VKKKKERRNRIRQKGEEGKNTGNRESSFPREGIGRGTSVPSEQRNGAQEVASNGKEEEKS